MDKVLEKFCCFLEEYYQSLQERILKLVCLYDCDEEMKEIQENFIKELVVIENLLDIFRTPRDQWEDGTEIFNDFDVLSKYLLLANFNGKESIYIVCFIIEKNLATVGFREHSYIVDSRSIDHYSFKTMRKSEAKYLIQGGGIREWLDREESLSELEHKKKEEIFEFVEKCGINVDDILDANQVLKEHYLLKKDCFDSEDIEKVLDSLKYLKLDEKLLTKIQFFLTGKYQKRVSSKRQKPFVYQGEKKNTSGGRLLCDREYKRLKRELLQYYQVYQNEILQELNREQVLYVLGLLIQLGYDVKVMKNFLQKLEGTAKRKNPLLRLVENYERYQYYQDNYRMREILDILLEYASDIFVVDDSEYLWVKEEMEQYLHRADSLVFGRYDYEIDCAKKLLKK